MGARKRFIHTLLNQSQTGVVVLPTNITAKGSTGEGKQRIVCPFWHCLVLQEKKDSIGEAGQVEVDNQRTSKGQSIRMRVCQGCTDLRRQREKSLKDHTPSSLLGTGASLRLLDFF